MWEVCQLSICWISLCCVHCLFVYAYGLSQVYRMLFKSFRCVCFTESMHGIWTVYIWNKCSFNCWRCKLRWFQSQQRFFFTVVSGQHYRWSQGFSLQHLDVGVVSNLTLADHILCYPTICSLMNLTIWKRATQGYLNKLCFCCHEWEITSWFSSSLHLKSPNNS